jgi:Ca-activated chloride channel homolog
MNHDENTPDLQTHIEPELEARLVASVLGEASAFETAELERLVLEKPELGIFKRRIEAVHGLVGTAVRPEQAPLRLAPERRAKILEAIGAAPARVPGSNANAPVLLALAEVRRKRRKKWIWASGLAASAMFATVVTVRLLPDPRPIRPEPNQTMLGPMLSVELPSMESATQPEKADDVLVLSPFEVDSSPSLAGRLRKALTRPAPSETESVARGGRAGGAGGGAARGEPLRQQERDVSSPAPAARRFGIVAGAGGQSLNNDERKKTPIQFGDSPSIAGSKLDSSKVDAFGKAEKRANYTGLDQAITLSPFTVDSSKDAGYAAGNTLAGTRLNTPLSAFTGGTELKSKIEDLASSITVVTKQQLSDRAAVDLNDVFLNERGLEGAANAKEFAFALPAAVVDQRLSQQKTAASPAPKPSPESPRTETNAAREPVSTFSLHVSDVSFRLAQTALARGETPDPTRIRPEEFYNAFDYGDPSPTAAEKITARIEQAAHPLLQQRNLVRIAMKVASSGRGAGQPLHLTILLDTSGSMEREDRIASVRRALEVLASLLGTNDRVTLIGFARQPRLLAEQLPGDQATKLADLASRTPFEGGTNLEEALKLAGELARRHHDAAAQNRIVLITDGAANLGNADPAQLTAMVEALRQQSIALDACGVGTDGLDDTVLEALTRKGDGRYYVLNKPEDADTGFARQLAGAFRPAAENVKVQVRFNPARVGSYRLIGFEQHRLREEDFRNDKVDAAELAADEAAVALYQVEVLPQGEGELGDVFVRFRDPANGTMVERSWTMLHEPRARAFDRATPTIQLAGTAALLADKLSGGDVAGLVNLDELVPTVNALRGHYPNDARVKELIAMFEQMRRRSGK